MWKINANLDCHKCPCCGETKTTAQYVADGIYNKGLSSLPLTKSWVKGLIRMRHMRCDCYKCYSCGAEWESNPYEFV